MAFGEKKLKFVPLERSNPPKFIVEERKEIEREAHEKKPDERVEATIAWFDLNDDKAKDFCVSYLSSVMFGNPGGKIACYIGGSETNFKKVVEVTSAPDYVLLLGSKTMGYVDLTFGSAGFQKLKIWKWNGQKYE